VKPSWNENSGTPPWFEELVEVDFDVEEVVDVAVAFPTVNRKLPRLTALFGSPLYAAVIVSLPENGGV